MDQTKMQHPNSVLLGSVKLEIAEKLEFITKDNVKTYVLSKFTDLGLGRGFTITPNSTNIDIQADNGTVPITGKTNVTYTIGGNILERHLPTLARVLKGQVHFEMQTGQKHKIVQVISPEKFDPVFIFDFTVYDTGLQKSIKVTQGATTLAEKKDYYITKINDTVVLVFLDHVKPTQEIKLEYEIASRSYWKMSRGSASFAEHYALRLTNLRDAWETNPISRICEFPYVAFDGEQTLNFKSQSDGDSVVEVPISFKATPHPNMLDDRNLSQESVMREIVQGNFLDD